MEGSMAFREDAATLVDTPPASTTGADAPIRRPGALIYARVSQATQAAAGGSLRAQIARCRDYAAVHDWEVVGEFQDVMSGTRDDRPSYRKLLAEASRLREMQRTVIV